MIRRFLPSLTLIMLAIGVAVMQNLPKKVTEPRCQYMDGSVRVDISVSSEKDCKRIQRAREWATKGK